jgi:hypothetical protein
VFRIHPYLLRTLRPAVLEVPYHPSLTSLDLTVLIAQVHPQDWKLYDEIYDLAREYRDRMSFVVTAPDEGATRSVVVCHRNRDGDGSEGGGGGEKMGGDGDAEKGLEEFVRGCIERRVMELGRGNWEALREVSTLVLIDRG